MKKESEKIEDEFPREQQIYNTGNMAQQQRG